MDPAQPSPPPAEGRRAARHNEPGNGAVAAVLAVAAIVAALVGTRAALISSDASDAWQSALRTEVKRSAAAINDVSFLYQIEFPEAVRVLSARLIADALRAAEAGQSEEVTRALEAEAAAQAQTADALAETTPLMGQPGYLLPSGGLDLGRRLADIRLGGDEGPALLALDPGPIAAEGDRLAGKASLLTYSLIPISICAFLSILAEPLRRQRLWLLLWGLVLLAGGMVMALVVEAVA